MKVTNVVSLGDCSVRLQLMW